MRIVLSTLLLSFSAAAIGGAQDRPVAGSASAPPAASEPAQTGLVPDRLLSVRGLICSTAKWIKRVDRRTGYLQPSLGGKNNAESHWGLFTHLLKFSDPFKRSTLSGGRTEVIPSLP